MTFSLRVLGDGLGSPSITSAKQVSDMSRNNWQGSVARDVHTRPVEFTVNPAAGLVRAMSDITIKVKNKETNKCSNAVIAVSVAVFINYHSPLIIMIIAVFKAIIVFFQSSFYYTCRNHLKIPNQSILNAGDPVLQHSQAIQTGSGGGCWGCRKGDHDFAYQCQVNHKYTREHPHKLTHSANIVKHQLKFCGVLQQNNLIKFAIAH